MDGEGEFEATDFVEDDGGAFLAINHLDGAHESFQDLRLGEEAIVEGDCFVELRGKLFRELDITISLFEHCLERTDLSVRDAGKVTKTFFGS